MRIKFFDYITKVNKKGKRYVGNTKSYTNVPLAHCIGIRVYVPLERTGKFEELT